MTQPSTDERVEVVAKALFEDVAGGRLALVRNACWDMYSHSNRGPWRSDARKLLAALDAYEEEHPTALRMRALEDAVAFLRDEQDELEQRRAGASEGLDQSDELSEVEREAIERAMLSENRDIAMRSPRLGFEAGWLAARDYYEEQHEGAYLVTLRTEVERREQVEERERALRDVLQSILGSHPNAVHDIARAAIAASPQSDHREQVNVPGRRVIEPDGREGNMVVQTDADRRLQAVVDFLNDWRFCPVATSPKPSRQCLEDAAAQLLASLPQSDHGPGEASEKPTQAEMMRQAERVDELYGRRSQMEIYRLYGAVDETEGLATWSGPKILDPTDPPLMYVPYAQFSEALEVLRACCGKSQAADDFVFRMDVNHVRRAALGVQEERSDV